MLYIELQKCDNIKYLSKRQRGIIKKKVTELTKFVFKQL